MFRHEGDEPFRVMLYSHDSVGLGHIRRNLALAHTLAGRTPALTGRPVTGILLTGVGHGADLDVPEGFDVVLLPGVRKEHGLGYQPRHMQVPMGDLIDIRERLVSGVITGLAPDLIIVDRHAYGVDGELRQSLVAARRERPDTTIVLGLREVLDEAPVAAHEWDMHDLDELRSIFDEIWVYGDPRVHDIRESGEIPAALHDLVRYTGYLATGRRWVPETDPTPVPYVLTMAGGGSDGHGLLSVAARAAVPAGYRHLVVAGPQMPAEDLARIQRAAAPGTRVVASVPDGLATIRRASAVISMAGYNTVCEVMSTDNPALLVPRESPRQEQLIRTRALADVGAVDLIRLDDLTPARLTDWIRGAVTRTQDRSVLDLAGLAGVADRVAALQPDATTKEFVRAAL